MAYRSTLYRQAQTGANACYLHSVAFGVLVNFVIDNRALQGEFQFR